MQKARTLPNFVLRTIAEKCSQTLSMRLDLFSKMQKCILYSEASKPWGGVEGHCPPTFLHKKHILLFCSFFAKEDAKVRSMRLGPYISGVELPLLSGI